MVKSWDRVFQRVFETADPPIQGGHPHRFRDTFAVSLLLKGVSSEIVSKLLGHSSIKVTERHYSPWIKARQELLETEVRRIWIRPSGHQPNRGRCERGPDARPKHAPTCRRRNTGSMDPRSGRCI